MKQRFVTVAVSGAFDPIHVGHIRYIREAAKLCDVRENETVLGP